MAVDVSTHGVTATQLPYYVFPVDVNSGIDVHSPKAYLRALAFSVCTLGFVIV